MNLPILLALGAAAFAMLGDGSSAAASSSPAPKPKPAAPKPAAKPAARKPAAAKPKPPAGKVIQMPVTEIEVSLSELDDIDAAAALAAAQLDSDASPLSAPPSGSIPKPLPSGYDPAAARKGAVQLAAHLKRAGRAGYDRRQLGAWQAKAGLIADRIYGGATRGALVFYGAADAPPAFFPPTQAIPYVPPEKR